MKNWDEEIVANIALLGALIALFGLGALIWRVAIWGLS